MTGNDQTAAIESDRAIVRNGSFLPVRCLITSDPKAGDLNCRIQRSRVIFSRARVAASLPV